LGIIPEKVATTRESLHSGGVVLEVRGVGSKLGIDTVAFGRCLERAVGHT
jgi:hypothetical protein